MSSVIFNDHTKEVIDAKNQAVQKALEMIGLQCEGYAKLLCPVDTGNLRNSITHTQADETTEAIGSAVEYAAYVELGTQRTKAQPYLKPAVTNHISEYKAIAESCLKGLN